jgi:hypothetical protein
MEGVEVVFMWCWKGSCLREESCDQAEDLEKAPEVQPRRAAFGLNYSHVFRYFDQLGRRFRNTVFLSKFS